MTDYTAIADTQVDPFAPVTSELLTALRDNPIAVTEGSVGAPRVSSAAIDVPITLFGAGSGSATGFTFFSNLSMGDYALLRYDLVAEETAGGTQNSYIEVVMSNDGGSTWSSPTVISGAIQSNNGSLGFGYVDMRSGTVRGFQAEGNSSFSVDATVLSGGGDALQFRADVNGSSVVEAAVIIHPITGTAV